MALTKTFPAPTGAAISSIDSRKALAAIVLRTTAGVPRAGVSFRTAAAIVTSRASMGVDFAAFEAVVVRDNRPAFISNDASATLALDAAPASNKRKDLVWVRQRENSSPYSDGDDNPVFGFTKGAASASPSADWASVPAGALVLAEVEIPSTATTTQSVGVVITQYAPYTALTGCPIFMKDASVLLLTGSDYGNVVGYPTGQRAIALDTRFEYKYDGSTWKLWNTHGVQSYTPTLVGFGLTSTTVTGRYEVINGRVIVDISVSLGASTTMTGNPTASLPTGLDIAATYASDALLGEALCLVASNNYKTLTVRNSASTVIVFAINVAGTYASLTSLSLTVPAASWGAGAVWRAHAEYDAA